MYRINQVFMVWLRLKNLIRKFFIHIGFMKEENYTVLHIENAFREYAKTYGKRVEELTLEEKQLAILNATIDLTTY